MKLVEFKKLARNERFSKNLEKIPLKEEKKKWISPMSNPWKLELFKK